MKIGRAAGKSLAKSKWMKAYWERRKARSLEGVDSIKCSTCDKECTKKTKGALMGRCSREANKLGREKPACEFIPA